MYRSGTPAAIPSSIAKFILGLYSARGGKPPWVRSPSMYTTILTISPGLPARMSPASLAFQYSTVRFFTW